MLFRSNIVAESDGAQNRSNLVCYKCGKAGHTSTICRAPMETVKTFQQKAAAADRRKPRMTTHAVQDSVECEEGDEDDDDVWAGCQSSNAVSEDQDF